VGARGLPTRVDGTVAAVGGITALGFVFRVAVLVRPIGVVDKLFIPDDTYYTLTIARSIAHGHGPTVDGHTLTSGFQALLGFLMVPVFWVTDNPDTALRLDLAFLVVVDTATIVVLAWVAYRFAGRVAAVAAAALWAISPSRCRRHSVDSRRRWRSSARSHWSRCGCGRTTGPARAVRSWSESSRD
jgi:hypothetical protein